MKNSEIMKFLMIVHLEQKVKFLMVLVNIFGFPSDLERGGQNVNVNEL